MNEADSTQQQKQHVHASALLVAAVIVIMLLTFLYVWGRSLEPINPQLIDVVPLSQPSGSQTTTEISHEFPPLNETDEVAALEEDMNATNLTAVDANLEALERELVGADEAPALVDAPVETLEVE